MAKFLDENGLSHLWSKLKALLNNKADSDHTHSAATTSAAGLMSASDKSKLDGIATGANKYTHPSYTGRTSGLYKITVDNSGHVSDVSAVEKSDITALGIPGQDTNTTYGEATTSAAGLMSSSDKSKLDGIASGANKYVHPTYTARTGVPTTDATPAFGDTFSVSQPVSDETGHVTAVNSRTVTIPKTEATQSAAGLMSAADKKKLDGIASGANNYSYTHPTYTPQSSGLYKITVDATGHVSDVTAVTKTDITDLGIPGEDTNTTYDAATQSAPGLMSAADKEKLDGIAASANNYSHPAYTARTSGLYKITVDATGHVSEVTAVAKADITGLGIPGQDTTYSVATQSADGLMSADDKTKLDGFAPVTTAGTGAAYTATVPGATLTVGTRIIIVTHTVSTSTTPTLDVNSLGAKQIRRPLSNLSTTPQAGYSAAWLASGKAFSLIYDGTYWIVESMTRPATADLSGTLALGKGGTGATTAEAALTNLGAMPIAGGTFTGAAYAGSSVQTPGTSMLRNSKLVSAEETPTVAGEIFWLYA